MTGIAADLRTGTKVSAGPKIDPHVRGFADYISTLSEGRLANRSRVAKGGVHLIGTIIRRYPPWKWNDLSRRLPWTNGKPVQCRQVHDTDGWSKRENIELIRLSNEIVVTPARGHDTNVLLAVNQKSRWWSASGCGHVVAPQS